jgi:hypothetical protein
MRRTLLSILIASGLLMGSAQPASTVSGAVRLMDFEDDTGVLIGYPNGQIPLGWFKRTENTNFVIGPPGTQYPPNPCRGLAIAWNRLVESNQSDVQRGNVAFGRLLSRMAQHSCNADITRDTRTEPQEILDIHPVP